MPDQPSNTESESTSELAIARRVAGGDRYALARMYELYFGAANGTALRILRSPQDAEDVVQDVFASLPTTLRTFRGTGALEGWIRRVTSRVALMYLRKYRKRIEVQVDGSVLEYLIVDPTDSDDVQITKIALQMGIQKLPEKYRLVFILKEIEGFSHGEVANLLEINARTSRVRLHRARRLLRRLL
jgi:RNA polymerase sigma-70 factor (ECF subfamily)